MKPKGKAFISGAYSGTPQEIEHNIAEARLVVEKVLVVGWIPTCPNVYWHTFAEYQDYDFWLEAALKLLEDCDVLVLVPGWENSSGAGKEVIRARLLGIPILLAEHFEEWSTKNKS
jgi:hypothetical protein